MSDEDNTLLGRAKRYSRVTTGLAGVLLRGAGRWAGGTSPLDLRNAKDAARMLGALRGPLMKGAQIAGGLPDVFPPDFAAELAKLQNNAPAMGPSFVRRRMAAELGSDWQKKFGDFDLAASHAASLGQVHRAKALDGQLLACKLQYPDMQSAVEADLTQLRTVLALQRVAERKFDTSEIADEVAERIREELDYAREVRNMQLFQTILAAEPQIAVPRPIASLCTNRLITMTWLEGTAFQEALKQSEERRELIAKALFDAWLIPLFKFGVVHGDAHFGNYTVRDDAGINLLDFGCVRIVQTIAVGGLIDLYRSVQSGDRALAAQGYEKWGFTDVTPGLVSKMDAWSRMVFGPLTDDRVRTISEGSGLIDSGVPQMWALWEMKQRLREGDAVKPPRAFVIIARAVVGLASALAQLNVRRNWHRAFEQIIDGFSVDRLAQRQAEARRAAGHV